MRGIECVKTAYIVDARKSVALGKMGDGSPSRVSLFFFDFRIECGCGRVRLCESLYLFYFKKS